MVLRNLYFDQKLGKTGITLDPLATLRLRVVLSLAVLLVTLFVPGPPRFTTLENSLAALDSSPLITGSKGRDVPVFAYYYIWFDARSWDRAKMDYPALGRYSSDDPSVMRQHIRWAKDAGIDGFLVSWKGTDKLNRRLDQLVDIAEQEDFKLAINYESLTFERTPLPIDQVNADLDYFIDRYVDRRVFYVFDKPLVIWSGTPEFSPEEIQRVVQGKDKDILILASEKNLKGYQRLAKLVNGNAYYWSSVNPDTHPGYVEKLTALGEAIHANGGLWIAPAAPGFDSRLLGGTTVIDRKDGETLRNQINAALRSAPDVIGIISWNEFSENSHIEPSEDYGRQSLKVLSEIRPVTPNPQ